MRKRIHVASIQKPAVKTPGYRFGLEDLEINLENTNFIETIWEVKLLYYIPEISIRLTKLGYKRERYKDYSHCIVVLGEKKIPNKSSSLHKNISSSCSIRIQVTDQHIPLGIYSMKFEAIYTDGYNSEVFEFSQKILIKRKSE